MKDDKTVDTRDKDLSPEDALIKEVHSRFRQVHNYDLDNRMAAEDDLRMLVGEDHWPKKVREDREKDNRPCLTINKLPSFADQVTNDNRLNKIAIKIVPYGGGATQEIAETMNGLIRNIENVSNADVAYQTALEGAVHNAFGYFRITTRYEDETTFNQEIHIERVRDPMTVYLDHHAVEHDSRDARFGFVTEMVSRDEYKIRYPDVDITPFKDVEGEDGLLWAEEEMVRIAEYWVKRPHQKKLYLLSDGRTVDGNDWDKVSKTLQAKVEAATPEEPVDPVPTVERERTVDTHIVEHYLVGGDQIIEGPTPWAGKYIPIVPVWGNEIVINGKRILLSLIRFAKDPQRMYNYFRTAATETVALTPKAPYIIEESQVEGHEDEWEQATTKNRPYLTYKGVPGMNPPKREVVTQTAIGEITEANISNEEMKDVTSLHDPSLGAEGNEVSGRAILARQRKGDIANYIFHDNLRRGVKYAGDIMIDLIPKIYDTMRQVMILQENGDEQFTMINEVVGEGEDQVIINDLTLGRYKVVATTGPSFTTQRMESNQSMMDFLRVAPETANLIIDLVAENMDWPGSQKIAERFRTALGINEDGSMAPKQPSVQELIDQAKLQGIELGNIIKKLTAVKNKRELVGHDQDMVKAGAAGAIQSMTGQEVPEPPPTGVSQPMMTQ